MNLSPRKGFIDRWRTRRVREASTVTVLVIEHKHGVDVRAFSKGEDAQNYLGDWARRYWSEIAVFDVGDTPPEDRQELIEMYFDTHESENYVMEAVPIDG